MYFPINASVGHSTFKAIHMSSKILDIFRLYLMPIRNLHIFLNQLVNTECSRSLVQFSQTVYPTKWTYISIRFLNSSLYSSFVINREKREQRDSFILEGSSERGAHVGINLCYLICLRHWIKLTALTNR